METKLIPFGTDLNVFTQTGYYKADTKHIPVNLVTTHIPHLSDDGKVIKFWNVDKNFHEYTKTLFFNEVGEYQGCEVIKY